MKETNRRIIDHATFGHVRVSHLNTRRPSQPARGGSATIVGMVPYGLNIEVHGFDLLWERRLQGSMMGGGSFRTDMPRLIELYFQGRLHLDDWISDRIPLEDINQGFAAMKSGKGMRSIIEFG